MFNILILLFGLLASPAFAQNTTCATRPQGDSSNACASTRFVHGATDNMGVTSIAALRAATLTNTQIVTVAGYYTPGDGGGGQFIQVPSDTTSADNSCTIIRDAAGNRFYRTSSQTTNRINVRWCGAKADDTTAQQSIFQNAISISLTYNTSNGGGGIYIPGKVTNNTFDPTVTSSCYLLSAGVTLPSTTTNNVGWDFNNPFVVEGDGKGQTCIHYTGTDKYTFSNSGIGGTTNRDQNAGLIFRDMTFVGPKSYTNSACAIGTNNQHVPQFKRIQFFGYVGTGSWSSDPVGGCAIHLYSYQSGGSFGPVLEDLEFGIQKFQTLSGNAVYSLDDLRSYGMRSGVRIDGPYNTSGKVSDVRIIRPRAEAVMVGLFRVESSGSAWSSGVGSSQNIAASDGFYANYVSHSLEKGVLDGAASTTVVTLRSAAGTYLYSGSQLVTSDTGGPLIVRIQDPNGIYQARYISAASGRQVTVGSAFPFIPIYYTATATAGTASTITLPVGASGTNNAYRHSTLTITGGTCSGSSGDVSAYNGTTRVVTISLGCTPDATSVVLIQSNYEVGYSDPTAQAEWPSAAQVIGHVWYSRQGNGFQTTDTNGYFENSVMIVLGGTSTGCLTTSTQIGCVPPNARPAVTFINPNTNVSRGWSGLYEDGSAFVPNALSSLNVLSAGSVWAHNIQGSTIVGDPQFMFNVNPLMYMVRNGTGHTIYPGDVVVFDNNGGGAAQNNVIDPSGSTTNYKCLIVTAPAGALEPNFTSGGLATVAFPGQFVRINIYNSAATAVAVGDEVIAQAGTVGILDGNGSGTTVGAGSVTTQQLSNSCAKMLQSATGGVAGAGTTLRAVAR